MTTCRTPRAAGGGVPKRRSDADTLDWTDRTMRAWEDGRSSGERGDFKGKTKEGRDSHSLLESADPRETIDPDKERSEKMPDLKRGGKLTAAKRRARPPSAFALPGRGAGPKGAGAGSYPVNDVSHARNAMARVSQYGSAEEKAKVRAAVHRRYPNIGKD